MAVLIYNPASMRLQPSVLILACVGLTAAAACGPQPDLRTLKLVPTMSGYYDDGVQPDGQNRLLPSMTFQLKNEGTLPITYVDLVIAYWPKGADGEKDSKQIHGITGTPLEPGAASEPITVRSGIGFTSLYPRAEFFSRPEFVDFIIKAFAKHRGRTVSLGEHLVERRLLPAARKDGTRP